MAEAPTAILDPEDATEVYQAPAGASPTPTFTFSAGQIVGDRYRVVGRLGRGGMGEVWQAYDLKLRVDVALKSLLLTMGEGEEAREVLRAEVRAAREVISPNVCRLFDVIEIGGQELVSMEYIDGQTLQMLLDERGPLAIQEAREIGAQLLAGLEAIHQAGLVHRDIKPENIMLTRSGRVVVMDFGLTSPSGQGALAGTPAYMAPEQGRGEGTDARADVFSVAMVLAEMLSAERGPEASSRRTFWEDVRREPPVLPETPWTRVLLKGVASDREERYASAAELALVLEEITVRVDGAEEEHPYPGLSSFSEEDSRFFFGREAEVEALWKRLQTAHLLGLIGSSGSGKSSFLNAGLLPVRPDGWVYLKISPGRAPFEALGRALLHEIAADAQALANLEALESPEGARSALQVWRGRHAETLLIVDQFEELFTQNDLAVQESFARLLSQAALEDGVRVLLAMRDDFLIHCQRFSSLAPVFSELTPLGPPVGPALRRALTQPALSLGYRFEDEAMVEEMLTEVSRERGALPVIAFTTARLWEERDSTEGLLTRAAYDAMGGVGGALAGHAEATLEAIGDERVEIVREVFRNLVTAQGTRAVMEVDDVLSVFPEAREGGPEGTGLRGAAESVLQSLVDARLLTSYEVETTEGEESHRRIEIVHESLLTSWPRLVHWRRQDAEGAQLRDELRQAAKLWESRDREPDLLWSGTAFREFELWRERYRGGLTALEEEYVGAMVAFDQRQRRRRRLAASMILVAAVAVSVVMGLLWRSSEAAREEATLEARRAEASKLVTLARLEEERYPTAALAYATRSLELADSSEARRLALRVLWRGPVAQVFPIDFAPGPCGPLSTVSRAGDRIAIDTSDAELHLFSRDGTLERIVPHTKARMYDGGPWCHHWLDFSPAGDLLVGSQLFHPEVSVWSMPDGELLRTFEAGPPDLEDEQPVWFVSVSDDHIVTLTWSPSRETGFVQFWPLGGGEAEDIGWTPEGLHLWNDAWDLDPTGTWLAYAAGGGRTVRRVPLAELGETAPEVVGSHTEAVSWLEFSPQGDRLVVQDPSGGAAVWSLAGSGAAISRFSGKIPGNGFRVQLAPLGPWLAWGSSVDRSAFLWDTKGPPELAPVRLHHYDEDRSRGAIFDPKGEWLATVHNTSMSFWPLDGLWSQVLEGPAVQMMGNGTSLLVTPDGRELLSCFQNGIYVRPLVPDAEATRTITSLCTTFAKHPSLPEVLMGIGSGGGDRALTMASIDGTSSRSIGPGIAEAVGAVAIDPEGRQAVVGIWSPVNEGLRIVSLESGEMRVVPLPEDEGDRTTSVLDLRFVYDGTVVSAGEGGARRWDLDEESSEIFLDSASARLDVSADGRLLLVAAGDAGADTDLGETRLFVFDLESGDQREITTHGTSLQVVAFGPDQETIVTGDAEGVVRVGALSGEEPHLLLAHDERIKAVTISPDGRWVFSSVGSETRRWPMPDLSQQPLHVASLETLLDDLRSRTNLTVVEDSDSPNGWTVEVGPFALRP